MAIAVRIDQIIDQPGRYAVIYTQGAAPLSAQSDGNGVGFTSKQEMIDFAKSLEQELLGGNVGDHPMLRFLLAAWQIRDVTLANTSVIVGKVLTIDFSAANFANLFRVQ